MLLGLALIVAAAVLIYVGLPDKNGESPPFLRYGPAMVTYPPLILVLLGLGIAEILSLAM